MGILHKNDETLLDAVRGGALPALLPTVLIEKKPMER